MEEIIGKKKIRVEQCLLQKQYLLLFNLTALLCLWEEKAVNRKLIKFLPDYYHTSVKKLTFNTAREEEVFGRNHLSLLLRETYTALLLFYMLLFKKKSRRSYVRFFFLSIIEVVIKRATNAADRT